jgi:hypothetical protein
MTLSSPPAWLLGAGLLFWGWETGFLLPAVFLALAMEAASFRARTWDPPDRRFRRIWDLCGVLVLLMSVLALTTPLLIPLTRLLQIGNLNPLAVSQESSSAAYAANQMLPLLFAPIVLALRYSIRPALPVEVFVWTLRNRRQPAGYTPPLINPGYPYLVLCLTSAGAANQRTVVFFAGASLLLAWMLLAIRPRRFRLSLFMLLVCSAVLAGYFFQSGVGRLQHFIETRLSRMMVGSFSGKRQESRTTRTSLGEVSRMKSHNGIVMRLRVPDGKIPPALLRSAAYDRLVARSWSVAAAGTEKIQPDAADETRWTLAGGGGGAHAIEIETRFPSAERLLYLPGGAARVEHLAASELVRNRCGAIAAVGASGYARYRVHYARGGSADPPPTPQDSQVPEVEQPAVTAALARLNLPAGASLEVVRKAVADQFETQFTYSTRHAPDAGEARGRITPLANFLLNTHAGQCEYFATATVLLLRQAGIPARYAIGYLVPGEERPRGGFLVRGRHAHAWCLYYDNGRWHDFDTTPGGWLAMENARAGTRSFWRDAWDLLRLRLGAWFATHAVSQTLLPAVLVALILFLVWRRLRRRDRAPREEGTRRVRAAQPAPGDTRDVPFRRLEARLEQLGYPRPASEPAATWLRRIQPHLPLAAAECDTLLALHYRDRFDPAGLDAAEDAALRECVAVCLRKISV